jgi:hypothetical protein
MAGKQILTVKQMLKLKIQKQGISNKISQRMCDRDTKHTTNYNNKVKLMKSVRDHESGAQQSN